MSASSDVVFASLETMQENMTRISNQPKRRTSRVVPVREDDEIQIESEVRPPGPPNVTAPGVHDNQPAVQVWNEMFGAQSSETIIESFTYVREDMAEVLSTSRITAMVKEIAEEMRGKKDGFLRHKDRNVPSLRTYLRKLFTNTLV